QAGRWVDRVRVTRVHAGALHVLHDAGYDHRLPVGDGVDLDLITLEVLVDEDGPSRHRTNRPHHVAGELSPVVNDLHGAAAQHVRRTHEHRVPRALGDG